MTFQACLSPRGVAAGENTMSESENTKSWQFQRMGDNDQVLLRTVAEIRRLPELDPKLWGALSCPASGLEYDKPSAAILDTDGDGRIRVPEVLEAVNWTCARLADTVDLSKPEAAMPLSAIDTSKPEGQHLGATARALLSRLGHPENESISQEEAQDAADSVDQTLFNGDGVIPASDELEPGMKEFVEAGIAVCGGAKDASDMKKALEEGGAHAVAAGSMFVYWGPLKAVLINAPAEEELYRLGIYRDDQA